jgi:hypothetical protein
MLHSRIRVSIRVPVRLRKRFSQHVIRLTVHPLLFLRTQELVRWSREAVQGLAPIELVLVARKRYPTLSLSSAVEITLVDFLVDHRASVSFLTPDEEQQTDRFRRLSLNEKIRITQKRMQEFRYLNSLT